VKLATAELLDGARDQRQRLVSAAGEGIGGAEGRGDERCPDDEMPCSAEVVARSRTRVARGRSPRLRYACPRSNNPKYSVKG
jgi:hypothetical protein